MHCKTKAKLLQNSKISFTIFLSAMVIFTVASCSSGETTVIKTAKSLIFFPDTYERQYQLGDVISTTLSDVEWFAKKIDGDWYVTLHGKLSNIDNLPREARQMVSVYKNFGFDITKVIYSFDFLIQGKYGQIYSGGAYYDGEYSEAEDATINSNLRLLYMIHDNTVKN